MKRWALWCLLIAGCAGSGDEDQGPLKYQAWCHTESKPLGEFHEDREVAEEVRRKHRRTFPFHEVRIYSGRPKEK